MCGRKTLTRDMQSIIKELAIEEWEDPDNYLPSYNIAPTQTSPVLVHAKKRKVSLMRWGLIPFWAKDKSIGSKLINARAETVNQKPSYQNLVPRRRCLVIADGYYEWKQEGSTKQPYYIQDPEGKLLLFAGLWNAWQDPNGDTIHSYTIITTKASKSISNLHHRMPVMIAHNDINIWIQTEIYSPFESLKLINSDTVQLEAYPVSTAVNYPKNNSPELIQPLENEEPSQSDQALENQ
ncbi:SOS response-associated peptidase [Candidatus Neomarinimicrobiota bacterium]